MKYMKLFFAITLAINFCACATNNNSSADTESVKPEVETIDSTSDSTINTQADYSDLIKTVYEKFVFAVDADPEVYAHPEQYFTANALKRLKDSYEFDCEDNDCYAFYALRTQEQDSKPGTNGDSSVVNIESVGDGWYIVKYSDMGWSGMTRIKIVDGKIDDFNQCTEEL